MDFETIKATLASLSLQKLLPAVIALIVGIVLAKLICKLFDGILDRSRIEKSLHSFLRSVFHILVYVIVGLIVAGTLGFNVSSLVALLSVVSLAFSLAVQGTLSNIAGGIQVLTSQPFHVGDYVEVGGVEGTVQDIDMIYTHLITVDSKGIYLPNSEVASSKVTNFTVEGKRRVDLTFTAAYGCQSEAVRAALLRAGKVEGVLTDPAPETYLSEYGESCITYILRLWCKPADYWKVYFTAIENVHTEFDKAGLEMSYPHLNVHIDK